MSFPPSAAFAPVPPVTAMGKETGSEAKKAPSTSTPLTPSPFFLTGQLQSSHLLPLMGSCKTQWLFDIPMEEGGRETLWCKATPLSPPLGVCHFLSKRGVEAWWVFLEEAAVSIGSTVGQWHLLERPFLLSASPISQTGKPRHRQRTHLGTMEAQSCTAHPCPT